MQRYLERRLGPLGRRQAWSNFFIKPFGAPSFASFWRQWNPVYGYFLSRYCYRPLSKVIGRRPAMLATFVICGLVLHDVPAWIVTRRMLPPGGTIAMSLFGVGAVLGEAVHMDTSSWPAQARAATNLVYIGAGVGAMLGILRFSGAWSRRR